MVKNVCLLIACLAVLLAGQVNAEVKTAETVVVTATRTPRDVSQAVSAVTVITADQIVATGATGLEEVLRNSVGLHVTSNGTVGALALPSIRGSESGQVLVLLDGVRLNSTQNGQFNLSNLPIALSDIERIEVLRGPSAALYGSNALAGVIQIITQQPEAEPVSRIGWSEGRFETRNINASTAQKIDRIRYRLGVQHEQSQGYRDNSDLEEQSVNGLFGVDLGDGYDLELSANYLDKEIGVPGSTSFPSPQARQWDKNTQSAMTLTGPIGLISFNLKGIYNRKHSEYKEPGGWTPTHDTHLLKTYGSELQLAATEGGHNLMVGGDIYQDKIDSTANGKRDQEHWSSFGQYEIKLTTWATFLVGLRYDAHSDFDSETSPRAAAMFALSDSTQLRLSAAKAFRAPTLNDRFWPDTGWVKGNPNLTPETAWEYEVAIDQQLNELGNISAALFLRDAKDLIEWAQNGGGVWTPSNVSEARIWGVEVGSNLQLHKLLSTGANYTYLHPKNETTDAFILGKARHQAHLFFDIGPVEDTRLRLDGRYLSYYPEANRDDESHVVFDASASRPFMVGNSLELELKVSVKNLFDEKYQESVGYPMPPRQFFAGVTAYF